MNLHIRPGKLEDYQGTIAGIDSSLNQLVSSIAKISHFTSYTHVLRALFIEGRSIGSLSEKKQNIRNQMERADD